VIAAWINWQLARERRADWDGGEASSLHRSTRLRPVLQSLSAIPVQPGLSLASCQLIHAAITAGTSRVAYGPLCLHAVANTPAGLLELVRSYRSTNFGLPTNRGGSAPALSVSGPAQRSLTLRPARSPSRLATLCTRGFSSLVAFNCCSDCYRVERPVPGRVTPAVDHRLFTTHPVRRHYRPNLCPFSGRRELRASLRILVRRLERRSRRRREVPCGSSRRNISSTC